VFHRRPHSSHVHVSPYGTCSSFPQWHETVIGGPFIAPIVLGISEG